MTFSDFPSQIFGALLCGVILAVLALPLLYNTAAWPIVKNLHDSKFVFLATAVIAVFVGSIAKEIAGAFPLAQRVFLIPENRRALSELGGTLQPEADSMLLNRFIGSDPRPFRTSTLRRDTTPITAEDLDLHLVDLELQVAKFNKLNNKTALLDLVRADWGAESLRMAAATRSPSGGQFAWRLDMLHVLKAIATALFTIFAPLYAISAAFRLYAGVTCRVPAACAIISLVASAIVTNSAAWIELRLTSDISAAALVEMYSI
jgi:hypothetical protein